MITYPTERAHEQTLLSPRTEYRQMFGDSGSKTPDIDLFYRVLNHYRITCNLFDQSKPGILDQDEYVYKNCRSLFDSLDWFFYKCDQYLLSDACNCSVFLERLELTFGSFFQPIREFFNSLPSPDDFRISNYFYQNSDPTGSTFNRLINRYLMESRLARSVRARKEFLLEQFVSLTDDSTRKRHTITSLGCGTAIELCEFIYNHANSKNCVFHCIDSLNEALYNLNRHIARMQETRPVTLFDYHLDIINLGNSTNDTIMFQRSEFLYCCGLLEYLTEPQIARVLQFAYAHLGIGGRLVCSSPTNIGIYRSLLKLIGVTFFQTWTPQQLLEIAHNALPNLEIKIETDLEQTNNYIWIHRYA